MCAIINVSMKDLSRIIKDFKKLCYKGYVCKKPKHEPNDSNFYVARQLAKSMTRDGVLNFHAEPVRTEMTGTHKILTLHVCDLDKIRPKEILAGKKILQVCSINYRESETVIVH